MQTSTDRKRPMNEHADIDQQSTNYGPRAGYSPPPHFARPPAQYERCIIIFFSLATLLRLIQASYVTFYSTLLQSEPPPSKKRFKNPGLTQDYVTETLIGYYSEIVVFISFIVLFSLFSNFWVNNTKNTLFFPFLVEYL